MYFTWNATSKGNTVDTRSTTIDSPLQFQAALPSLHRRVELDRRGTVAGEDRDLHTDLYYCASDGDSLSFCFV